MLFEFFESSLNGLLDLLVVLSALGSLASSLFSRFDNRH